MPETRDARSVIEAAEQAAAAGDYASAEQLLREAALLQEASLGPLHPDLANTLNNLGVVCEITEKPIDAEDFFRRAYAIARTALEPDHPFVATSRKNLEDFCTARGKPVDLPLPASTADDRAPATVSDELPPQRLSYEEPRPVESRPVETRPVEPRPVESQPRRSQPIAARPVPSRRLSRPLAIGGLIAGGLFLAFIATAWFRSTEKAAPQPGNPSASPGTPAPTAGPPPAAVIAPDAPRETTTKRGGPPSAGPKTGSTAATGESGATAASASQSPVVADAQLCRDLSPRDWHCVPPSLPVAPGPLFFYTRLKSPAVTTVQHRWYHGDRLRQAVELPIRANPTGGYRTYSRNTVDRENAGDWKVELRTRDGVLLHEERFVVR